MALVSALRLERPHALNPFVAADICIKEGKLTQMCHALHAAAVIVSATSVSAFVEELATLPVGSPLSAEGIVRASFDEGGMERLCDEYLWQLRRHNLGRESSFDSVLVADLIAERLDDGVGWSGSVTLHAHSWTLGRQYKLNGWHILAPLIIAFSLGLPALAELKKLHRTLDHVAASSSLTPIGHVAVRAGLVELADHEKLILFFTANRWDVFATVDRSPAIGSTHHTVPCCELLAYFGRDHGWIEASGLSLRAFGQAASISYRAPELSSFLRHHKCARVETMIGLEQLAIKALLRSKVREHPIQGIQGTVHRALLAMLLERQAIVSISQLRQHCGLPNLRINPHVVESGRILVYAPSPRFLEHNAVSFALRDWVQDSVHSKARISPDRIFTPLAQISWKLSRDELVAAAKATQTFRSFGLTFWTDIRPQMGSEIARQARTWAEHRLEREASKVLREAGLVHIGDVYLDADSWADALTSEQPMAVVAHTVAHAHDVPADERQGVLERLSQKRIF